jgi:hypothetical protein
MNTLIKGLAVGALQCALALSIAGKFGYDRATCPRAWVRAVRRDPELPIRGRYLALRLSPEPGSPYYERLDRQQVVFFVPQQMTEIEKTPKADVWAEVTIPRSGPPRPIRLEVR